ncbi:MAG: class I SAM-dependent methyltransferase [Xanthomonadales bacterium]|nr:class I SAM-dependent methyltransferase [Xanthomonadales bacterium]
MSYDRIAPIYDADMGASMALPDVGYYLEQARLAAGPVLELGCGSGRVLQALLAEGLAAVGIDRSLPMLRQARLRCGSEASLLQMDMRQLALRGRFALALLPYSLVTYLLDEADWQALAQGLSQTLQERARIIIDAFIPRPQLADGRWMRDYARRHQGRWLVRHKRIQQLGDGSHRIERRYRLWGAFGGRTLCTREQIRAYAPDQLRALCEHHLGRVTRVDWDYGEAASAEQASFCTLTVQR